MNELDKAIITRLVEEKSLDSLMAAVLYVEIAEKNTQLLRDYLMEEIIRVHPEYATPGYLNKSIARK